MSDDERKKRGRSTDEAIFPVAPSVPELPGDYVETLDAIKKHIASRRVEVVVAANRALIGTYWEIGRVILERQQQAGWGAKVIDRLSADLREAFPDMSGFSSRNLKYMRAFAAAWSDPEIVQQVVAQLPWGHVVALIDKLSDPAIRDWYAERATAEGWSRAVLTRQIASRLHERQGQAQTNFPATLPSPDSDLAQQVFKDPYLFDFLGTAELRRERELEQALVDHVQAFLLELGTGFAFVGRQVPLEVGDQTYRIDLLFYHLKLRRYVVVELKVGAFEPSFVGQLNLYLSAVDDLLRHPDDQPTIGLLLCSDRNELVVEYALRGLSQPIGVAGWETELVDTLPASLEDSLPTVEELEAELTQNGFGGHEDETRAG